MLKLISPKIKEMHYDLVKNLSFPDSTVERFEWKSKTLCIIKTQGALLEKGQDVIEYCNLYIFLGMV